MIATEALICEKCLIKVDEVLTFIQKARLSNSEVSVKSENSDDDRECRCCKSTSRLKAKVSLLPLLREITGINVIILNRRGSLLAENIFPFRCKNIKKTF